MKSNFTFILFFLLTFNLSAQEPGETGGEYRLENNASVPCISPSQYELIESNCNENAKRFIHAQESLNSTVQLNWPLKLATGLTDCGYYFIAAHVDQDPATTTFKDYTCGSITYDGHKGTDIAIWPFPFYKMDNDQVEVIAAAAGTIIDKHDGEFDKNCVGVGSGLIANYIVVQHADSSRALYWHMKKNSLTSKTIGQSVAAGEKLGIVGSSGSSSGPHLHFEVWAGSTTSTYNDPFSDSCNALNASTWWASQKPYREPALLKVTTNTTDVVIPPCPATEISNEADTFFIPFQGAGLPTGYAKFYIFLRNETNGTVVNMSILDANSTVLSSWTHNCTVTMNATYWGYSKVLPTIPGTYTFQATYNNTTCTKNFIVISSTDISESTYPALEIYPNPFANSTTFKFRKRITSGELIIYNQLGAIVKKFNSISGNEFLLFRDNLVTGIYLVRVLDNDNLVETKLLVVN